MENQSSVAVLLEEYRIVWGEANRQNDQITVVQRLAAIGAAVGVPIAATSDKFNFMLALVPVLVSISLVFILWKELMWNICLVKLIEVDPISWAGLARW